jgi:hypothetical protein
VSRSLRPCSFFFWFVFCRELLQGLRSLSFCSFIFRCPQRDDHLFSFPHGIPLLSLFIFVKKFRAAVPSVLCTLRREKLEGFRRATAFPFVSPSNIFSLFCFGRGKMEGRVSTRVINCFDLSWKNRMVSTWSAFTPWQLHFFLFNTQIPGAILECDEKSEYL